MGPLDGRQPRRGRFRQDHRDIESARPHDDRPTAAGAAQDRHAVGPAWLSTSTSSASRHDAPSTTA